MRYARNTNVSPESSLAEARSILARYGAVCTSYYEDLERFSVGFTMDGFPMRMTVQLPAQPRQTRRDNPRDWQTWEQAVRQRWRAFVLVLKARLEAVESGAMTWREAWFPYIQALDGSTLAGMNEGTFQQMFAGNQPIMLGPAGNYQDRG